MVKTSHITMPYDHLFKTKRQKQFSSAPSFIFFVWQFSLTVVKRKNKVIITANQCQETCHMEPGELKVRKPNYLKRRKTRVNKSRLVLVWNFFVQKVARDLLRPSTEKRKPKLHLVTLVKKLKTALTPLMILFKYRVRAFFLISYLFLLAERAVFKFPLEMTSNAIKLKQPTRRSQWQICHTREILGASTWLEDEP